MSETLAICITTEIPFQEKQDESNKLSESIENAAELLERHINELFDNEFKYTFSNHLDRGIKLYNLIKKSKKTNIKSSL